MTILVTGGNGQVASALADLGGGLIRRVGRPDLDFDRPASVEAAFGGRLPSLVVNAAAYTGVDAAETDAEAAFRANRDGPALLARLCAEAGIPLIHLSTDYVFDGLKGAPYIETDPTSPQGVYGTSKLAGETAVLAACPRAIVLRTSWIYAGTGKNFVRTMLAAGRRNPKLRVVADQIGCPTNAAGLAAAILSVAARLGAEGWNERFAGVFHAAGTGSTSWHGFARAIFEEAARDGVAAPEIEAITTGDWPTPARRPPDSRLNCDRLAGVFGVRLPPWRESLGPAVKVILDEQAP